MMNNEWNRVLLLFGNNDIWTRKNLLNSIKSETEIDKALELGYIVQCGTNDIGDIKYCITELGKQIRDN